MTEPNREAFIALEKEWMAQTEFLDYRNWLQDELIKARGQARLSTQREAFEKLRQQACDRACSAMPDEEMYAFSLGFEAGWQARLSTHQTAKTFTPIEASDYWKNRAEKAEARLSTQAIPLCAYPGCGKSRTDKIHDHDQALHHTFMSSQEVTPEAIERQESRLWAQLRKQTRHIHCGVLSGPCPICDESEQLLAELKYECEHPEPANEGKNE